MEMNTQQIVGVLKKAGYVAQRITRTESRSGYQVAKLNGRMVGVLCGPYVVDDVADALVSAGFSVCQRDNAAKDALFVWESMTGKAYRA